MSSQNKIISHLKLQDPVLYQLVQKMELGVEELVARKPEEFFISLCDEIISQQLSGKVASVIFTRLKDLFKGGEITPVKVLQVKDEDLRATGMSWSKVKFIKDLAARIEAGELELEKLVKLADEEVIEELTKVKGIGRWTAEMFLMFTLGREDVFSLGDLGLKNAIKKLYGIEELTSELANQLTSKWKPYRTYAARILWRSLDNK